MTYARYGRSDVTGDSLLRGSGLQLSVCRGAPAWWRGAWISARAGWWTIQHPQALQQLLAILGERPPRRGSRSRSGGLVVYRNRRDACAMPAARVTAA